MDGPSFQKADAEAEAAQLKTPTKHHPTESEGTYIPVFKRSQINDNNKATLFPLPCRFGNTVDATCTLCML